MYRIFILALILLVTQGLTAQTIRHKPPIDGFKYVQIDDPDHNFGDIPYGKEVSYSVKMKNISQDTLYLSNVIVSCGCTTPQYKTGAYAPGAEIPVTIGFNGHSDGNFNKTISLLFQDKTDQIVKILRFRGNGIVQK